MPVTIRRACQFCRDPFEDDIPSCDCCPECGGGPKSYGCDSCIDTRNAMRDAAKQVWVNHLRRTRGA
jgi:hypothetical protein